MATNPISPTVKRLIAEGRLKEAGNEVGREIQARIQTNRNIKPRAKRPDTRAIGRELRAEPGHPVTPEELIRGGMAKIEAIAGARARDVAIRAERKYWLPRLESWHAQQADGLVRVVLGKEIKRLRRLLGVAPDAAHTRALTRARVAKWRARHPRAQVRG